MKNYDAIIVLCNNIRKTADGYRPTTYSDYDQYGMLAGQINVIAASLAYWQKLAGTFIFSTGSSQKTKATYGPDVPSEASVYSAEFARLVTENGGQLPYIIQEDRSVNTYSNLIECYKIIKKQDWKNVGILTVRYHLPRAKDLSELAKLESPIDASLSFLSAEDIIIKNLPGVYDQIIDDAYASEQGQNRLKNEAQGLQDMADGKYIVTEFQLHK